MTYTPLPAPFPPSTLARWPIRAAIEGGTVARLFRVTSPDGGDACAKLVAGDAGTDGPSRRFEVERAALARLPARDDLPGLLDVDLASDGTGLLVIPYVEGANLRRTLAHGGPPGTATAVSWTRLLLAALDAVHGAGLVHCDVKPENVVVRTGGEALVLVDFGLATPVGTPCVAHGGASAGTPRYMAPEQVLGAPVDARTDVYAAAVVLYELLVGAPPFTGGPVVDVRTQQLQSRPVPPGVVAHDGLVPAALDDVVLRALEKAPEKRFGSAAAFDAALADALG